MTPDEHPPVMPDDPPDGRDLAPLLRAARAESFAPGFADRVMRRVDRDAAARVDAHSDVQLPAVMARQFARLVPAVLAASLVLAAANWWRARDAASPLAGAIGLPSATVASALTLSSADADLP